MGGAGDSPAVAVCWACSIAQRTPWSGLLELAYVGNSTSDIPNAGNGGSIDNDNAGGGPHPRRLPQASGTRNLERSSSRG
jgi:hypothetical protein